jgi:hypothetical protein
VLSRRTAIGGFVAATVALITGCTSSGGSGSAATRTPAPRRSPSTDPDVLVAATVLGHEQAMLERVTATARRHPRLARTLVGTRDVHRAHVALLTKAVPDKTPVHSPPPARGPVPPRPAHALAALSAAESRLSGSTAHSSLVARSGPFARVLASMAAAASQQSARLAAAATELG